MKIDLVKINIGDSYKYKFNRYEPCCDEILDNPCIDFTNYNLTEETPDNEPRYCLTSINSYDDVDWEAIIQLNSVLIVVNILKSKRLKLLTVVKSSLL